MKCEVIDEKYRPYCKSRFALPSPKQLTTLEERLGVTLPSDFREYLLRYNGGEFREPAIEPTIRGCPRDRLTFMHGVSATFPLMEIGQERDILLFEDNVPPVVIPVGYTMMGNLILLSTDPSCDFGSLVLATSSEWWTLANNVETFFTCLVCK